MTLKINRKRKTIKTSTGKSNKRMADITEEQLKNMTPEQIKDMQKQQCIFCQIIEGKVASRKVYEDDRCIAILDINPANPGHVLIIPKEHYTIMPLMPEKEVAHIFKTAKKISMSLIRALKAEGTNIFVANGAAAGQKAPHFMVHLIPRKKGDSIKTFELPKNNVTEEDQHKLRQAIKLKTDERFGVKTKEPVVAEKPKPQKVATEFRPPEVKKNDSPQDNEYMFEIPPPPEQENDEKTEEPAPKFDLDEISNLVK